MMNYRYLLLIIILILLGSCTMAPEYKKPLYTEASTWPVIPGYDIKRGKQFVAKVSWQQFYKSPSLKQMIKIALENNRDLKLAVLNIQEARALYRVSRADLYPNINAITAANIRNNSDISIVVPGQPNKIEQYQADVGVSSFELDLFGKIRSQNDAALNSYFATKQNYNVVMNALIAEVASAYIQLLADQELVSITQKTLEAQQKTRNILSKSFKQGITNKQDVDRADTSVVIAEVNLHQFKRNVQQDKNVLFLLLGVRYNGSNIPDEKLYSVILNDDFSLGLPSDILLLRPDVQQAEYNLISKNANIGAARAAFFPSINLTGRYGYASLDLSDLFIQEALGAWSFIPQITLPIFQAGRNMANLDLAHIRKTKEIVNYEKVIQNAFKEVSDELAAKYTLAEQLKAQEQLVQLGKDIYDKSLLRYTAGIESYLSVLDAQREHYNYQQNAIKTKRDSLVNAVNLYKALGGGVNREFL